MKILLVHNFYGSSAPSGENEVYLAETELLRQYNHEVIEYTKNSDLIRKSKVWGTLRGAFSTPWNPFSAKQLRLILKREMPDIMHVHNTFPLISPAIFHTAKDFPTATVLTIHNYRIFCAAAIPMRDNKICTKCLDRRSMLASLKYGCYRNSRTATIPLACMIGLHRQFGTWKNQIDAFIALTNFQKDQIKTAGLPSSKIYVKPNFYPDPPPVSSWGDREKKIIFIGRLGKEKGVNLLIEVWKKWGDNAPLIEIIGDGPERDFIQKSIIKNNLTDKVFLLGQLPFADVQKRLAKASLLIAPSLCFEGFPMVIREAFALGVPVAASEIGSIPCIVRDKQNGVLFEPGNVPDILNSLQELWNKPDRLRTMGQTARSDFEEKYTGEISYKILMKIYQAAIRKKQRKFEF